VVVFDEERIHASALRIISIRPHSSVELRRKLLRKGNDPAAVDRVVTRLVDVDLINDDRFAHDYIEFGFLRKSWGMRKVRAGLLERGIDRAVVEDLLGSPDAAHMERKGALAFVEKETRNGDTSPERMKKIARTLASRGFGWDVISRAIEAAGDAMPEP
jgi:regulatory protein